MKTKALVVDDDDGSRMLVCDLLRSKNIECIEARTGNEALTHLSPDLTFCITDIMLPDINGYELAKRVREKYPETSIIAYTASLYKVDRIKLAHTDLFDDVLLKPIELENFNEVIDKFL